MNLKRVLERLTATIPVPKPKPVKAANSYRGLAPGQWLQDQEGTMWQVTEVNSQGAKAQQDKLYRQLHQDWKDSYKKAGTRARKLKLKGYL